jgi:hypothetical protein
MDIGLIMIQLDHGFCTDYGEWHKAFTRLRIYEDGVLSPAKQSPRRPGDCFAACGGSQRQCSWFVKGLCEKPGKWQISDGQATAMG